MKKSFLINLFLLMSFIAFSQGNTPSFTSTSATMVVRPAFSEQAPTPPSNKSIQKQGGKKNKRWINYPTNFDALPKGKDALVQNKKGIIQGRGTIQNFEGAQQEGPHSVWSVPDPTGAIGPNHYVHAYNIGFVIYDRSGNILLPHSSLTTLWDGEELGDPVVFYDRYVDRFVITQFSDTPNGILFAICKGPDPVNDGWFTYRFNLDDFPDYPKYSIWHDGYYMTANKPMGNVVYVFERDEMIAGSTTAQIVGFDLPSNSQNDQTVFGALAMNSVGPNLPDASKPGYIVYLQDDAWASGPDHLKIWDVELDWATTTNSTISSPAQLNTTPFDSFTATFGFGEVPQPGVSQKIDGITGVVSYMCNYWDYGSHISTTLNFNVDVNNDDAILGIRWLELRESAGNWSIYQEGTYAPDDGLYRFMGSMSMDEEGNIGMGFNVGNSTTYPSLRYTGRYAADPLGEMTIAEKIIIDGEGSRPIMPRFGDYAQLTLDPTDNLTFWHIGEYVKSNEQWSTRVASFKLAPNFNNDIGSINIHSPVTGILTNSEAITVTIFNYGYDAATNFDISYQIDGGTVVTETYNGTLNSVTSAQYTFSTTADFSTEGHTYSVMIETSLPSDENAANDGVTKEITHLYHNDVGMNAIVAPVSGDGMGMETITVTVKNFGGLEQSNFDVSYTLDGTSPVTEQVAGPLAAGATLDHSFVAQRDFSDHRDYNLSSTTALTNDGDTSNDPINVVITNSPCTNESNNTPQTIESNSNATPTSITSVITISENDIIIDIDVTVNITHVFDGGLDIYLTGPDGTQVELSTENGGIGHDYVNTVFDDEATDSITNGTAPFTGSFQPEGNLSDFYGLSTQGDWTLEVTDNYGLGGTFNNWNIRLCDMFLSVDENIIDASDLIIKTLGNNHFIVSLTGEKYTGMLNIKVFNLLGQEILSKPLLKQDGNYTYPLNMDRVASGIYIVRLGNNSFAKAKRIIVK